MTTALVGLAVLVGIVGTLLPIIPGLGLIWLATLAFGLIEGFGVVGVVSMVVLTAFAVAGTIAGVRTPQRAAAAGGIGLRGQVLALVLAVVGFFVIPVVGAPVGFVLGIHLVARRVHPSEAWSVTRATIVSFVRAAVIQFWAAVGMAFVWVGWVAWG